MIGYTLQGAWRYLEHDWVSLQGDIVQETPGSVHTLVITEEAEILFIIEGALEFLDGEDHTLAHEDWLSIIDKYRGFCAAHAVKPIDITRPRVIGQYRMAAE